MIEWPLGKQMERFRKAVNAVRTNILKGNVLVIDPGSHRLGYATTKKGKITGQGVIEVPEGEIKQRLQSLVLTLQDDFDYDVLAIEKIRGTRAHIYLKWAVGAVVGSVNAPILLEVPIPAWKAVAGPEHYKDDDTDAYAMAETILAVAKELE